MRDSVLNTALHLGLAALACSAVLGGCRRSSDESVEPILTTTPDTYDEDTATLRRVDTTTTELDSPRAALPVAELEAGGGQLVWMVQSPQLIRITAGTGRDEVTVSEFQATSGKVVVVDTATGIRLGSETIRNRPLSPNVNYRIFALPPGGELNQSTRSITRDATPQEQREAMAELEAKRKAAKASEDESNDESNDKSDDPADPPTSRPKSN